MKIDRRTLLKLLTLGVAEATISSCKKSVPGLVNNSNRETNYSNHNLELRYHLTREEGQEPDPMTTSVMFVLDNSGSMDDKINGERKIDSAKEAFRQSLEIYSQHQKNYHNIQAGLVVLNPLETVVSLQDFNYGSLWSNLEKTEPLGGTPLGQVLITAQNELVQRAQGQRYIVMLMDGLNNVDPYPEEVLDTLKLRRIKTSLYVIPFGLDETPFSGLKQRGAKVMAAKDQVELEKTLKKVTYEVLEAPPQYPTKP